MVAWANKRKPYIQAAVLILGVMILGGGLLRMPAASQWALNTRAFKHSVASFAKPAELGIFALVALYVVRLSFRVHHDFEDFSRFLLRLLQVIHIPLAIVVLVAAGVHGTLFTLYLWHSDFHYWSGVVALVSLATVGLLGLITLKNRRSQWLHRTVGLITFGLVLVHILTV